MAWLLKYFRLDIKKEAGGLFIFCYGVLILIRRGSPLVRPRSVLLLLLFYYCWLLLLLLVLVVFLIDSFALCVFAFVFGCFVWGLNVKKNKHLQQPLSRGRFVPIVKTSQSASLRRDHHAAFVPQSDIIHRFFLSFRQNPFCSRSSVVRRALLI